MVNNSDDTDLKIVDFGLSKIIGPQETSLDPFGTLVSDTHLDLTFIVLRCPRGPSSKALWQGSRLVELGCDHLSAFEQSAPLRR